MYDVKVSPEFWNAKYILLTWRACGKTVCSNTTFYIAAYANFIMVNICKLSKLQCILFCKIWQGNQVLGFFFSFMSGFIIILVPILYLRTTQFYSLTNGAILLLIFFIFYIFRYNLLQNLQIKILLLFLWCVHNRESFCAY